MRKFTIGEDWTPKKLGNENNLELFYGCMCYTSFAFPSDIAFDVDDVIDISELRGYGLQPGEEKLPEQLDEQQNGIVMSFEKTRK